MSMLIAHLFQSLEDSRLLLPLLARQRLLQKVKSESLTCPLTCSTPPGGSANMSPLSLLAVFVFDTEDYSENQKKYAQCAAYDDTPDRST